ncbi:MAG: energy-coupled thiamine transporter ThiT [Turicibacter sp.]|nr:energy-coupled thiamine transporter ThiT [Turicibacter sp.]
MSKTKLLTVGAICAAMAFVLNQITIGGLPQGGSTTLGSMLVIALAGYWLGPLYGILVGITVGLLDTITGVWFVHPIQYLLDYPIAYGALGISGFFKSDKFGKYALHIGYTLGVLARFLSVFLAGIIFWGHFAPEGQPVALYSLLYNSTYIVPELIFSLILISIPTIKITLDRLSTTLHNT